MAVSADDMLARARTAERRGDDGAAIDLYAEVLRRFPANRRAREGLQAIAAARGKAGGRQRMTAGLLEHLKAGRWIDLLRDASRVLALFPTEAAAENLAGLALSKLGRHDEAIGRYRRAVALDPGFAAAMNNLGLALKLTGDRAGADEWFSRAVAANPHDAGAWRNLGTVHEFAPGDPRIAQMKALLARPGLSPRDRRLLSAALGKALDEAGEAAAAFGHLHEANRLARLQRPFDLDAEARRFDRIREIFAPDRPPLAPDRPALPRPVFVVGMPRSGTTLVEQILAAHPMVHGAGEPGWLSDAAANALAAGDPASEPALAQLRADYLSRAREAAGDRAVIVDKMPANFRWAGFILLALPEARVLDVRRHPVATCFSIYRQVFQAEGLGYSHDLADLGRYYRLYHDLMTFFSARFPGRIENVDYEALADAPETGIRRIVAAAGLDWDEACLGYATSGRLAATASRWQVQKPIYRGSSAHWRRYEAHLGPLLAELGALAD